MVKVQYMLDVLNQLNPDDEVELVGERAGSDDLHLDTPVLISGDGFLLIAPKILTSWVTKEWDTIKSDCDVKDLEVYIS